MREWIQLDFVKQILSEYTDDFPLHLFLREFYKKHRQFGSRDRKFYSDVIYKYFRCKTLFPKLPFEEKLCYSGFITTSRTIDFYNYLLKLQNVTLPLTDNWHHTTDVKLDILEKEGKISLANYFPGVSHVAEAINKELFLKSHFSQPDFFVRVSENRISEAVKLLTEQNITFMNSKSCFVFASQIDLAKYLPEDYFEVQDLSSQNTIELFELTGQEKVWDCCSGAGGKGLMLMDTYPEINLFCSDKRQSILENLKTRFQCKKIKPEGVNVYDVVKNRDGLSFNNVLIEECFFDIVLADVPCSGSGTWGRTPERLYQFKEEEINVYRNLQRSVIENSFRYLKPGGKLIYITCSVYEDENNLNVRLFEKFGLKLEKEKYFQGYDKGADTMYGAVLRK